MKTHFPKKQSGFTLVEIAIVLVIIGLLLGGVLKGAELIENSKVRKTISQINGVAAAYYSYLDRYSKSPGDDGPIATLQARGSSWAGVSAGNNNNSFVALNQHFASGGGEQGTFWQHLKAAGFIPGKPADTGVNAMPKNAFSGIIGITTEAVGGGLTGIKVCLSQVTGTAAASLDLQLDDGNGATGKFRARLSRHGIDDWPDNIVLAAPYSEDQYYTVCSKI